MNEMRLLFCDKCGGSKWFVEKIFVKGKLVKFKTVCCECELKENSRKGVV